MSSPSPTNASKRARDDVSFGFIRKRRHLWDVLPPALAATQTAGASSANGAPSGPSSADHPNGIATPSDFSMSQPLSFPLSQPQAPTLNPALLQLSGGSTVGSTLPLPLPMPPPFPPRPQSRLYVGSLTYNIWEDTIKNAFSPFGYVMKVDMPKEGGGLKSKGYCFVEYSHPESAVAAMKVMNGVPMAGRPMKVGRPPGVMEDPQYEMGAIAVINRINVQGVVNPYMNPALLGGAQGPFDPYALSPNAPPSASLLQQPMNPLMSPMGFPMQPSSLPFTTSPAAALIQQAQQQLQQQQMSLPILNPQVLLGTPGLQQPSVPTSLGSLAMTPNPSFPSLNQVNPLTQSRTRIYVGSVAFDLNEEHIRSLFADFGKIRSCQLIMDPQTGRHRGYGFIDFEEEKAAADAILYMNGFSLMKRNLKVNFASNSHSAPQMQTANMAMPNNPTVNAALANATAIANALAASMGPPAAPSAPLQQPLLPSVGPSKSSASQRPVEPSEVVLLKNLVGPDEVDGELEKEVEEECRNFGNVEGVKTHVDPLLKKVYVYVMYSTVEEAGKAISNLNGRMFGGNVVQAAYYDRAKYAAHIYTDTE